MNNAAYLRHAELARVDFFIRTKIWKQLKTKNYSIGFVALNIRYRRELRLFKSYQIHTRALYWNELELIIEQRFIDPNTNFLHTIIYGKYVLCKNGKKVKRSINDDLSKDGIHIIKFYEKPLINNNINSNDRTGMIHVSSQESLQSSQNGYVEHIDGTIEPELVAQFEEKEDNDDIEDIATFVNNRNDQNLNKNYDNLYECRNKLPRSLKIWLQCLEQSSYESRRNLL